MNTPLLAITPVDYFGAVKGDTQMFESVDAALTEARRLTSYPDTKVLVSHTVLTTGQWQAAPLAFAQVSTEGWYNL